MKKKRFSVERVVAVLKQAELGVPVAEVIRKVRISKQTFNVRYGSRLRSSGDVSACPSFSPLHSGQSLAAIRFSG